MKLLAIIIFLFIPITLFAQGSRPTAGRLMGGSAVPTLNCNVTLTRADVYIRTTTGVMYVCTAAPNTWTAIAGGGGSGTVTVVGSGNLTSTALVTGGGSQTLQTPSATSTMDASGNISTPGTVTAASIITTGAGAGLFDGTEGTAPSGAASHDILYADSTAHRWKTKDNNGSADTFAKFSDNLSVFASGGAIAPASGNFSGALTVATALNSCADAGANDTYACSLSPAPAGYTTGQIFWFKANTANTGAASVNFNSLGAKTVVKVAGGITTTLADNDIRAGQWVGVQYDGTNMQMQSMLGNAAGGGGTPGGSDTQVQRNNAGAFGGITNATSDGTTLTLTSPKIITDISDTNGNELFKVTATGSAVNEFTVANAATGNGPTLSATGETNVPLIIASKGTGGITLKAGSNESFRVEDLSGNFFTGLLSGEVGVRNGIGDSTGGTVGNDWYVVVSSGRMLVGPNGSLEFRSASGAGVDTQITRSAAGVVRFGTTAANSLGTVKALTYTTDTNCSDSAGAAACGTATAGSVVLDAAATTVVVSTTSVTANSQIFIQEDSSLGTRLSVTCNTTTGRAWTVSARTAGTSFTVTSSAAPVTNPACLSFHVIN